MFFKIALRYVNRYKAYTAINVLGLAVGMVTAAVILIWIQNEASFDRFHSNQDRLYQMWNRENFDGQLQCWSTTPQVLGPALKQNYPEVEQATRVNWSQTLLFSVGDKRLNVKGTMVDPDFLTMFSFPLLKGDANTALN